MSKRAGSHNTPRSVVEEILRLHLEEGYTYRQLAEKFQKPFKTIQNMVHNEYKKQRQLLEGGKVSRSPSIFLNPTTEQYLELQRENRQLRIVAGFSPQPRKEVRTKIKFDVIHQYRNEYPIQAMRAFFGVSRSGYYRYVQHLDTPRKDAGIAEMIRQCHQECGRTYGYRRAKIWLEHEKGICLNEKTILRIMHSYGLLSEIRRRKGYRKACEHLHRYQNLLNRNFHAQRPNQKWVTDISYIQTGEGVLYLSMIRNLYDNSIVAYKTGAR